MLKRVVLPGLQPHVDKVPRFNFLFFCHAPPMHEAKFLHQGSDCDTFYKIISKKNDKERICKHHIHPYNQLLVVLVREWLYPGPLAKCETSMWYSARVTVAKLGFSPSPENRIVSRFFCTNTFDYEPPPPLGAWKITSAVLKGRNYTKIKHQYW